MAYNKKTKPPISIITPATQYANLAGVLNNGIRDTNSSNIEDLNDVVINNLTKNDILIYNGTTWVNKNFKEVVKKYIWVIDGGSAEDWEDPEKDDEPEISDNDNFAEELVVTLYDLINNDEFQSIVEAGKFKGLTGIYMEKNGITIECNNVIRGLLKYLYKNEDVSRLMGEIIVGVYDNISNSNIREVLDGLSNDINDRIMDLKIEREKEDEIHSRIFIYMSDSSGAYLDVKVLFKDDKE